jgi:hypothetical protein
MIPDPRLMGGYKRIIAQKPHLWKAENFANDSCGSGPGSATGRAGPVVVAGWQLRRFAQVGGARVVPGTDV